MEWLKAHYAPWGWTGYRLSYLLDDDTVRALYRLRDRLPRG